MVREQSLPSLVIVGEKNEVKMKRLAAYLENRADLILEKTFHKVE